MRRVMWLGPVDGRLPGPQVGFNGGRRLPLDLVAHETGYTLTVEVPGYQPDQIQVEWDDDVLVLTAEAAAEEATDRKDLVQERLHGALVRRLRLPADVDPAGIEATLENGLLTLQVPKQEAALPRRIQVQTK